VVQRESIFWRHDTFEADLVLASACCFCERGEAQVGFLIITTDGFLCGVTCAVEELLCQTDGWSSPWRRTFCLPFVRPSSSRRLQGRAEA